MSKLIERPPKPLTLKDHLVAAVSLGFLLGVMGLLLALLTADALEPRRFSLDKAGSLAIWTLLCLLAGFLTRRYVLRAEKRLSLAAEGPGDPGIRRMAHLPQRNTQPRWRRAIRVHIFERDED